MTSFKGHKSGFNKSGKNSCTPNETGPPSTKFCGRGGVPEGALKHYPSGAANISGGNRRLAKASMGDGGGSGTSFSSRTAFGKNRK